jgi:hypothetical protein
VVAGPGDVAKREQAGGAISCPLRARTCSVFLYYRLDSCYSMNNDLLIYFSGLDYRCLFSCFVCARFPENWLVQY